MPKSNPWRDHVKNVSDANKGKTFKEILKMAKKTYKKKPAVKKHSKIRRKSNMKSRRKPHSKTRRKRVVGKRRRSDKNKNIDKSILDNLLPYYEERYGNIRDTPPGDKK